MGQMAYDQQMYSPTGYAPVSYPQAGHPQANYPPTDLPYSTDYANQVYTDGHYSQGGYPTQAADPSFYDAGPGPQAGPLPHAGPTQPGYEQGSYQQAPYVQTPHQPIQYPQGYSQDQYSQAQYSPDQYSQDQYAQTSGAPGQPYPANTFAEGDDNASGPDETHVTVHPPGKLRHYLIGGGALVGLALAFLLLTGGGDDPGLTEDEIAASEESPEELAFDDLAERVDDLETDDGDDIIVIEDNDGYGGYGGFGGGCCGNGYGNGIGNGNGIGIGDGTGNGDGIIIDDTNQIIPDSEIPDGDGLVIGADTDEPGIEGGDGAEPTIEFPPCDVVDNNENGDGEGHGGSGDNTDGDNTDSGNTDGDGAIDIGFPYADPFDLSAPASWTPLAGSWGLTGEQYQQSNPETYGNISQLNANLPENYSVQVQITPLGDTIGGGVMLAQPTPGSRKGATVIDLTEGGTFLRYGSYDADSGDYVYGGGVATPDGFDPAIAHVLTIDVGPEKTIARIDDEIAAEFGPVDPGGMGLFTSLAAVSFDDLKITELTTDTSA